MIVRLQWRQPGDDEFAAGRALLHSIAAELTGHPVEITATCPDCGREHGKPTAAGVYLSLTRTPTARIAVASLTGPAGVDAEPLEGSDERLDAVEALTGVRSLRHWTRVEAVLKADGRGLRVDPSHVIIDGDTAWVDDRGVRFTLGELPLYPSLIVTTAVAEERSRTASSRTGGQEASR